MDSKRAAEIRQRMADKKDARKAKRVKAFVNTKRRRKNLKDWVLFQRQRFNFEEERKKRMAERAIAIKQRCGPSSDVTQMNQETITRLCKLYQNHVDRLQEDIYDVEYAVAFKNMMVNQLRLELDEMKGKFIKPQLKKTRTTSHWN